jgi:hypothetical protein
MDLYSFESYRAVLRHWMDHVAQRGGQKRLADGAGVMTKTKVQALDFANPANNNPMPDAKPGYDLLMTLDTPLEIGDLLRVRSPEHDLEEN